MNPNLALRQTDNQPGIHCRILKKKVDGTNINIRVVWG
jgi:hypothetical protein